MGQTKLPNIGTKISFSSPKQKSVEKKSPLSSPVPSLHFHKKPSSPQPKERPGLPEPKTVRAKAPEVKTKSNQPILPKTKALEMSESYRSPSPDFEPYNIKKLRLETKELQDQTWVERKKK